MKGSTVYAFVDNVLILQFTDSLLTSGKPGVGLSATPAGNSLSRIDLGPLDRIAPANVSSGTLSISAQPSRVDVTWTAVADDANGVGVWKYQIYRNGVFILDSTTPSFTDLGVYPGTLYAYNIVTKDYHSNESSGTSPSDDSGTLKLNGTAAAIQNRGRSKHSAVRDAAGQTWRDGQDQGLA